jgi:alpha-L-rhamnosidase
MLSRTWKAAWIWGGEEASPRNEWRSFRQTFSCPTDFDGSAQLHISADSRYVLYIDGQQIGRGPVRSWPKEQFYDTYEIGHLLRAGSTHTIAVLVLHFGVANFYYIRGRGGLIAEVVSGNHTLLTTDANWRTQPLAGFQRSAPRMACQQAFSEIMDARADNDSWTEPSYDDRSWSHALLVGPVGTAPWTKLIPRDIPFLTEETYYPTSIRSMHRVQTPAYMAAIDLRNQMVPESANHANRIAYCGYIATILSMEAKGTMTIGFPNGNRTDRLYVNGFAQTDWKGEQPEKYLELTLPAGDHLILLDVTSGDHGGSFHIGVDGDVSFKLTSPLTDQGATPFATYGPFDHIEIIDHQPTRELSKDHPDYVALPKAASAKELEPYLSWARPMDSAYYTEADVFGLNVWQTCAERWATPPFIQSAILSVPEPAVLPLFKDGDLQLVFDLGVERSGYIGFEVDAPEGTIVDVYGVEYMHEDYVQHTYGLDNTFRYICRSGRQHYLSPVRRGLRYIILTVRGNTEPVKLHELYFNQSTYPVTDAGTFRSSDSLLNEIWEISRHTTRLCMEDTFVDCPAYEQVFWVGDSRNEALVNYYVFGATDIVKRCLNLVPGSSDMTPLYVDQVPSAWNSVIPNWTFFWVAACEEYVAHAQDIAFAKHIWPAVRHTLSHYMTHLDEYGLLNMKGWNLLDWAPIDQPGDGTVTHQNMFFVQALRQAVLLAEAAEAADEAVVAGFAASADRLAKAINAHLWDEERGAYLDCIHSDGRRSDIYSMQTQVVAYLCDIAEGERKAKIDHYLIEPPIEFVQVGSPFMSFFYYEALVKSGRHAFMLDDIRRNYGTMIAHGATTCWEMYPNFAENRANPKQLTRSHCHAWSAAPGYFLGTSVLGINRLDAGWHTVEIAPNPSDLTWASGSVPLPQGGHLAVSWRIESDRMKLRIESPEDVQLVITLPEGMEADVEQVTFRRDLSQS